MRNTLAEKAESKKIPYQFFVVTFIWAWVVWLPLVLAGAGILPLGDDLAVTLTIPVTILAAFGPALARSTVSGHSMAKALSADYLRGLLDFRFGPWGLSLYFVRRREHPC